MTRFLNFLWLLWFTVGIAWLFQSLQSWDECPTTSPNVFRVAFATVLMESVLLCVMLMVCCCSGPLLWALYLWNPLLFSNPLSSPDPNNNTIIIDANNNIIDIYTVGHVQSRDTRRADKKVISSVTEKKKYRERDGLIPKEDATCAICLSNYGEGDKLLFLPCHHHFHEACISMWLKQYNKACPMCKADIDAPERPQPTIAAPPPTTTTGYSGNYAV